MSIQKDEQGRLSRLASFWTLAFLLLFGCLSLHETLAARFPSTGVALGGARAPLVGWDLSPAFLISAGVFGGGVYAVHRWLNRTRSVEMLVETEAELRKVTWPTSREVVNSSLVVIASVLILMGFLAGADWFLGSLMKRVLLG